MKARSHLRAAAIGTRIIAVLVAMLSARTASASDPLERAQSPLYRSTLQHAIQALDASNDATVVTGGQAAVAPTDGDHLLVTRDPLAQTMCINDQAIVCTRNPAAPTQCNQGSNTYCAGDPMCGHTSVPQGRPTICRGAHTMCNGQEQIQCTVQPGARTTCPVSRTFCPGRMPGEGDPNCFTFIPGGGMVTLCRNPNGQGGAQTACNAGRLDLCTRDPMSATQCTNSSRTRCAAEQGCLGQSQSPKADPGSLSRPGGGATLAGVEPGVLLSPASAAAGAMATIGIFAFDVYLVDGEMQAYFGEDIEVLSYVVSSSVESSADIAIDPSAVLGPRIVFLHAGDSPILSPGAWGEHILAVGPFEVTTPTDAIGPRHSSLIRLRSAPNPFKSRTTIEYEVATPGEVSLRVFDAGGRLVRELGKRHSQAGTHTASWDGHNDHGRRVPVGVYFLIAETPSHSAAWKIAVRD